MRFQNVKQSLASKPCQNILKNENQFLTSDISFYDTKGFHSHKTHVAMRTNSYLSKNITAYPNNEEMDKRGHTSKFFWLFVWITHSALLVSTL